MPSENPQLFEDMQKTIDKYKIKVVEEQVKTTGKLCPICGKNIKQDLKPHIERVHEGKKDCLCLICGSIFYADKDLKAHIKSVHEKLRPHKCTLCDSSFFKSYGLRQHTEAVHEGKVKHTLVRSTNCTNQHWVWTEEGQMRWNAG